MKYLHMLKYFGWGFVATGALMFLQVERYEESMGLANSAFGLLVLGLSFIGIFTVLNGK